jgi:Zn-dependent oligopeptidase
LNEDIFDSIVGWKAAAHESGEWERLTTEDHIYVNKVLIKFKQNGVNLDQEAKHRIKLLDEEVHELEL